MGAKTVFLCLLGLVTLIGCTAAPIKFTVGDKKAFTDAFKTAQATATTNKAPVDVYIELTEHLDLGNATVSLDDVRSLAIEVRIYFTGTEVTLDVCGVGNHRHRRHTFGAASSASSHLDVAACRR